MTPRIGGIANLNLHMPHDLTKFVHPNHTRHSRLVIICSRRLSANTQKYKRQRPVVYSSSYELKGLGPPTLSVPVPFLRPGADTALPSTTFALVLPTEVAEPRLNPSEPPTEFFRFCVAEGEPLRPGVVMRDMKLEIRSVRESFPPAAGAEPVVANGGRCGSGDMGKGMAAA